MISRSSRRQKFRILKLNFTLGCYKSRKNGNFMLLPQKLGSKNFGFRSFKRFYPTSSSYRENFLVLNITTEIIELSNPITCLTRPNHMITNNFGLKYDQAFNLGSNFDLMILPVAFIASYCALRI